MDVGIGFTVIVYVLVGPGQAPIVGVMVIVEVIGDDVALVAVKAGVLVAPLAPKPIAVLELVHVKVAPAGVLTKVLAGTAAPPQKVKLGSAVTVGTGFTVKVVTAVQVVAPAVAVTVYV